MYSLLHSILTMRSPYSPHYYIVDSEYALCNACVDMTSLRHVECRGPGLTRSIDPAPL